MKILVSFILLSLMAKNTLAIECMACEVSDTSKECNLSVICPQTVASCETLISKVNGNYSIILSCASQQKCAYAPIFINGLETCQHAKPNTECYTCCNDAHSCNTLEKALASLPSDTFDFAKTVQKSLVVEPAELPEIQPKVMAPHKTVGTVEYDDYSETGPKVLAPKQAEYDDYAEPAVKVNATAPLESVEVLAPNVAAKPAVVLGEAEPEEDTAVIVGVIPEIKKTIAVDEEYSLDTGLETVLDTTNNTAITSNSTSTANNTLTLKANSSLLGANATGTLTVSGDNSTGLINANATLTDGDSKPADDTDDDDDDGSVVEVNEAPDTETDDETSPEEESENPELDDSFDEESKVDLDAGDSNDVNDNEVDEDMNEVENDKFSQTSGASPTFLSLSIAIFGFAIVTTFL